MTTAPVVTITDELIGELDRLAGSATGGDWEYRLGLIRTQHDSDGYVPIAVAYNAPKNWRNQRDLNMEFIAAANPGVIRALLDERASLLADARRYRDLAEIANQNCSHALTYLSLYRPQLADEMRVFVVNMTKELTDD